MYGTDAARIVPESSIRVSASWSVVGSSTVSANRRGGRPLRRAAAELEGALLGHGREPAVLVQGQVDPGDGRMLPSVLAGVFF